MTSAARFYDCSLPSYLPHFEELSISIVPFFPPSPIHHGAFAEGFDDCLLPALSCHRTMHRLQPRGILLKQVTESIVRYQSDMCEANISGRGSQICWNNKQTTSVSMVSTSFSFPKHCLWFKLYQDTFRFLSVSNPKAWQMGAPIRNGTVVCHCSRLHANIQMGKNLPCGISAARVAGNSSHVKGIRANEMQSNTSG